jgi:hypothetical protein
MKLRAIISPVLIAVAGPGDLYPYDGPVADGPESALQSISVVSRYFDTVLTSGLGGPEDYFCRTAAQRQAINDAILAANPRPTGIYVVLDHENCNPYDSGVLMGSGTLARFPDVNTPTELVNETKMTEWYNDINELDDVGVTIHLFLADDEVDRYEPGNTRFGVVPKSSNPSTRTTMYGRERENISALVAKFKALTNLVWVVAEEYTEELTTARVSDIARHIRSRDTAHPVGVHQLSGSLDQTSATPSFGFPSDPYVDFQMLQLNDASAGITAQGVNTPDEVFTWTKSAVDLAAGRYAVVVSEISSWDKTLLDNNTGSGRTNLRRSMWQAMMAGAAGRLVLGTFEDRNKNKLYTDDPLWVPSKDEMQDWGRVTSFLGSVTSFRSYLPETAASYRTGATKRVMRRSNNTGFLLYSEACSTGASVGLGAGLTSGRAYSVRWHDALDGTIVNGSFTASGSGVTLTSPANIASDCVVWIR